LEHIFSYIESHRVAPKVSQYQIIKKNHIKSTRRDYSSIIILSVVLVDIKYSMRDLFSDVSNYA